MIAIGLCATMKAHGLTVQPFKKGPDYIDPLWLSHASGQPCYNLDFFQMQQEQILSLFQSKSMAAHIAVIEGNKGLHDGMDVKGADSNAALAKLLQAPVILVLDTEGSTRGIAPLLNGYQNFDKDVNIVGVILNKVASPRHEGKLRNAIEHYSDVPVLGAVYRNSEMHIDERHLGLVPSNETVEASRHIASICKLVSDHIDVDKILQIAQSAPSNGAVRPYTSPLTEKSANTPLNIGIIRDRAFGFYYADDIDRISDMGMRVHYIDSLKDDHLPKIDGLIIGGGFPECFAEALQNNNSLMQSVKSAIETGLPIYAECGGLMYLSQSIQWRDNIYNMVGALPIEILMQDKPIGRGYVELEYTADHPWASTLKNVAQPIKAHEFHYSDIKLLNKELPFAYKVKRGHGIDGKRDGIIYNNVLASYVHLRNTNTMWPQHFIDFVYRCQNQPIKKSAPH